MADYDSQQATAVRHNNSLDDTIKGGNDLGVQDLQKNMVLNIIMNNPTFISVPSLGKAYNNNNNGDDGSGNSWKVIMLLIFFPTVVVSLIHSVSSVVI